MSMLDAIDEKAVRPKAQRQPKEKKEAQPKTWEMSFRLYAQGMKPDLIARERNLTLSTVLGHLLRYVDSGAVDFDDLVSPEHQEAITAIVEKVGTDEGTTPIKNLCPPEVTYDEIRMVIARMKK